MKVEIENALLQNLYNVHHTAKRFLKAYSDWSINTDPVVEDALRQELAETKFDLEMALSENVSEHSYEAEIKKIQLTMIKQASVIQHLETRLKDSGVSQTDLNQILQDAVAEEEIDRAVDAILNLKSRTGESTQELIKKMFREMDEK